MGTVTKKDLILRVIERTNESQELVQDVVQHLFQEMNQQLGDGNRIELRDFGVFSFKKRAARIGHNPRTLEKVPVPAKIVVSFKMGKKMKDAIGSLMEVDPSESTATPPVAPNSEQGAPPAESAPPSPPASDDCDSTPPNSPPPADAGPSNPA